MVSLPLGYTFPSPHRHPPQSSDPSPWPPSSEAAPLCLSGAEEDHDHHLLRGPGHRHRLHLRRHLRIETTPPATPLGMVCPQEAPWLLLPSGSEPLPPRPVLLLSLPQGPPSPPRAVVCMISVTVCVSVRGASGEPGWETASGVGQVSKAQTQALAQAASPFPGSATQGSHVPPSPLPCLHEFHSSLGSALSWDRGSLWTPTLPPPDWPICPDLCPLQLSP